MLTEWTGSVASPIFIHAKWPREIVRGLFSFRHGGVSARPFHSLNVGLHVGDAADAVIENRARCAEAIGASCADFVVGEQVHGHQVAVITQHDIGRGSIEAESAIPNVDALVTNVRGISLVVQTADCVPVLFFDSGRKVVATAHSGWRGTASHIVSDVISTMARVYGTDPQDLDVWLGPSIRQCCYEVSDAVAQAVRSEFGGFPLIARFNDVHHYWLSLQSCIRHDLLIQGVAAVRIHDVGVCTACRTDTLFSYRAENQATGRMLGAVRLV